MAKLDKNPPSPTVEIVPLAWHVDYWNYLGWEDPYSSARYSSRQRQYARWLEASVYTPQMIVNGRLEFTGSDPVRARNTIRNQDVHRYNVDLTWTSSGTRSDTGLLGISIESRGDNPPAVPMRICYALTEDDLASSVSRGENAGKTLHHDAVVRRFEILKSVPAGTEKIELHKRPSINPDWERRKLNIVVFLQNVETGTILGVNQRSLHP